jgi:hypothetical protein
VTFIGVNDTADITKDSLSVSGAEKDVKLTGNKAMKV